MRGHTDKFLIESQCGHYADFYLYSSGGTLHTVQVSPHNGGPPQRKSFQNRKAARKYMVKLEVEDQEFHDRSGKCEGCGELCEPRYICDACLKES